ncbi:MAG: aminotransferase class V-fold PLP-dependent enzyme [Sphingomonadales bacterium]|nr:aminotransferase class V-fold PLP-dependent enzyme [Sphingomonadales bacterium]
MTVRPIYLDYAATTPLLPAARAAVLDGYDEWANPSSPHGAGRQSRAGLEAARARIKAALGWDGEVVLTSGASEALALAITRCVQPLTAVCMVEHDAVLRHAGAARQIGVDALGIVDVAACAVPGLVAVQQANNETGVLQPLERVAEVVHGAGGLLLADCAQTAGKMLLPQTADLIAISAHKFGGPVGTGALLVRDWAMLRPTGGQERGYRGGTENLPGALGMATALEAGSDWLNEAAVLRDLLDKAVTAAGGESLCAATARVPSIASYRMPGKSARAQLIRFDGMGIAVSAGSACSSGSLKTSHVLGAIGYPHADQVIRVSIGRETTRAEVERFIGAWREVAES